MQHVVLRATWYEGTARLLSLTEILNHISLSFVLLAELLTDEGGEETGVLGGKKKNLTTSFRKCHKLKPKDSSHSRDSNSHSSIGGRLGKQMC